MISEGKVDKDNQQLVYASLDGSFERKDCVKVDTTTLAVPMEFQLQAKGSSLMYKFSYSSTNYLASPTEMIYTKVTTVAPYYILVNQTQ